MRHLLIALIFIALSLAGCKKCIRSHKVVVRHAPWVQYQCYSYDKNGTCTMQIPIYHEGYDALEDVCDEYEQ